MYVQDLLTIMEDKAKMMDTRKIYLTGNLLM